MKGLGTAAASAAVIMLSGAVGAYAADLNTKAPVLKAAPADAATCTSIVDFFTTACQLAAYGVRFYGTIDIGYGYQTHGAPWDKTYGPSTLYMISKAGRQSIWEQAANGLSQSNIGIQIKEPLGQGWSLVGQLETAFDPYSMQFAGSEVSLHTNNGVPLALQTASGAGSSQGQFYNSLGFVGVSHDTWGTLTFMRQTDLMLDAIKSYDPMGGSYAFSIIGYQGTAAGGGDTENGRATTSVKYRVNYANYHFGLFGQFGGYDLGNASNGAFQADVGADYKVGPGLFSVDAIGGYTRDAQNESLTGGLNATTGAVNPFTPQTLQATISDNSNVMAVAKYSFDKLTLYAGYEWIQFAAPSDTYTSFTDTAGYLVCANCTGFNGTNIANTTFNAKDKILQIVWAGGRYAVTDSLDVAAAYYHYDQNQFATGKVATTCGTASTSNSGCAGTMDAASAMIDWKFAPKWDTYIGTMYSQLNGGLDSGFLNKNNWATTAGVRFRW
jgi:predicted porin